MPMFCSVLNRFNLDTSGGFYSEAETVVNRGKKEQRERKKTQNSSPDFLLPTCSLKAKKTGGNKDNITCSVWMTESKLLALQLLLS